MKLKQSVLFLLLVSLLLTISCKHTELIYIDIKRKPKIQIKPESTIVIHNFWLTSKHDEELPFRPEKEISQKFRDMLEQEKEFNVLNRKTYLETEKLGKQAIKEERESVLSYILDKEPDWQEITKPEPSDYLLLGDTYFEVIDGSGYEYRRVYDPLQRAYRYKEVFVQQKIMNVKIKIILVDVKKNKIIYEDTYNDSKTKSDTQDTNLEEFLFLSEYSIRRFIDSYKPEIEKQYRYLIGR